MTEKSRLPAALRASVESAAEKLLAQVNETRANETRASQAMPDPIRDAAERAIARLREEVLARPAMTPHKACTMRALPVGEAYMRWLSSELEARTPDHLLLNSIINLTVTIVASGATTLALDAEQLGGFARVLERALSTHLTHLANGTKSENTIQIMERPEVGHA
jgi:hypothetical protein